MNIVAEQFISTYQKKKTDEDKLNSLYMMDKRLFRFTLKKKGLVSFSHSGTIESFYIDRASALQRLFADTIKKYPIDEDMTCYVYMGDELPIKYQSYPIFAFAKKRKDPGILIPDWSFINPYTSTLTKSWDDLKNEVFDYCPKKISYKEKCYFRGRDTSSKTKHNIRKRIEDQSQKPGYGFLDVKLNPLNVQSITTWCDYKYLLDLPGSSPWSVRLKELFLLRSMIIKINTISLSDQNNEYINFYSPLLQPGIDYISIDYIYDMANGFQKCMETLKKTVSYYNKHPNRYRKIVDHGRSVIKELSLDSIMKYMSVLFRLYPSCLQKPVSPSIPLLDPLRPCGSRSRKPNRYTKEELLAIASKHGHVYPKSTTIDTLCKDLKKIVIKPKPVIPTKSIIVKPTKKPGMGMEDLFEVFKNEFRDELIGWLEKKSSSGYRTVLKGGQNLRIMLKEKHNMISPPTKDYDFSISTKTPQPTFDKWYKKVKNFVEQHKDVLSMKVNTFYPHKIVKVLKIQKYFTIFIFYKGRDFIDLAFTNERFLKTDVDIELSKKVGLPIQTLKSTFKELSGLIYRQSVVKSIYSYTKRNAFVGKSRQKGIKDLNRFKMLCGVRHFKPQCDLLKQLQYHFPITAEYLDSKGPLQINRFTAIIERYLKPKTK